ncbi:MAG: hypothetical protein NZM11_11400, partial [Anaerolineales bacterium]|nr:hypothetical protein [Anaerolineales bacterium]
GEGAHPDPASELAPVIEEILKTNHRRPEIVAMVVGTEADPQNMKSQVEKLQSAGCRVFTDPSEALAYVSGRFANAPAIAAPPIALDRFAQPLAALNVGLESFHASLRAQGAQSVHVDWKPPAAGNERLAAILAKMKSKT